jgi:hypothetical protein
MANTAWVLQDVRANIVGVVEAENRFADAGYPLVGQYSHVDDTDGPRRVFSRDCAEYHVRTPGGHRIAVLVNHFKSKGYGGKVASDAIRHRQATHPCSMWQPAAASSGEACGAENAAAYSRSTRP